MKKAFFTIMFIISLVMLMSESDSLFAQIAWTSVAFVLFAISGKALTRTLEQEGTDEQA